MKCSHCENKIAEDADFCDQCGFPVREPSGADESADGASGKSERPGSKLIPCEDCGKKISPSARACPNCGCPNEEVVEADRQGRRSNRQGAGCLIMLLGIFMCMVSPFFGGIALITGFVILLVGLVAS